MRLDQPPVEIKVDVATLCEALGARLETDPFEVALVDGDGNMPVGVGDRVAVRVAGHDPDRQLWLFEPADLQRWERTVGPAG